MSRAAAVGRGALAFAGGNGRAEPAAAHAKTLHFPELTADGRAETVVTCPTGYNKKM